jgi:hypothetical protein
VVVAKFSVSSGSDIDGSTIGDLELDMSLLRSGWPQCFQSAVDFDCEKYEKDPSWSVVTPTNLLLRANGQASPEDTSKMDRLLQYAPNQAKLIEDLGGHVSKAYLKEGDGCDDLLRLLPKDERTRLYMKKNPETIVIPGRNGR